MKFKLLILIMFLICHLGWAFLHFDVVAVHCGIVSSVMLSIVGSLGLGTLVLDMTAWSERSEVTDRGRGVCVFSRTRGESRTCLRSAFTRPPNANQFRSSPLWRTSHELSSAGTSTHFIPSDPECVCMCVTLRDSFKGNKKHLHLNDSERLQVSRHTLVFLTLVYLEKPLTHTQTHTLTLILELMNCELI